LLVIFIGYENPNGERFLFVLALEALHTSRAWTLAIVDLAIRISD
jgi:hypothetical protein